MRSFLPLMLSGAAAAASFPKVNVPSRVVRQEATTPTVTLDYCTLAPAASNTTVGYYKYQNIRFAAVPTGHLRFAAPEWPPVETEINDGSLADADVDCASYEDCLYMDVWMPANAANRSLPVLVWTYGGGFTGGSKAENTPEGLFDLSTDFIFVSYNYRLGMTGLATSPTLLHEGGTSNAGLWDVQHAFQWVQKYISNFGGDPDNVTAMGFSAGGSQVIFEITRFAGHAEQLFKQAYIMSPGYVPGAGHEHAEAFYQNVSTAVGCEGGSLTCLRSVDFDTLTTAASDLVTEYTYQMQPRVDGDFVADTYEAQLYQGRFNFTGPLVITHEAHEVNYQAYTGVDTTEDVSTMLKVFFPSITDGQVQTILALYPEADYTSPGLRFSDMKQHFDLTAHNLALTHALDNQTWNGRVELDQATHGTDQSYYWYSTYSLSDSTTTSDSTNTTTTTTTDSTNSTTSAGGVGGGGGSMGSTAVDATIAVKMQKYLMSFVLSGDPNALWAEDKLEWPLYNESNSNLVFNATDFYTAADDLANAQVAFWNKVMWY